MLLTEVEFLIGSLLNIQPKTKVVIFFIGTDKRIKEVKTALKNLYSHHKLV